ncbi:MAG: lytic murein transglycosylase [Rhodocyclaceae bacterium]
MNTTIRSICCALAIGVWALSPAHAEDAEFARCLAELRGEARGKGVPGASFDRFLEGVARDDGVLALLDHQPEFRTPIWDYMAGLVDDERVTDGLAQLAQWRDTLQRVEERFAVDPETVVAIWGVESNFGRIFGRRQVVSSLATLACFGRRQSFFRGEFLTTLRILEEGHFAPEQMVGSWAGAFGHTQFMPSTFMRIAVDFDGDGRRDLINSVPDALASTANYLRQSGWRHGEPWGYEVVLPAGFDVSGAGRRNKQPMAGWIARGVKRADGGSLPANGPPAGLLLPAGPNGPAFLVSRNFDALFSYNAAESYALAIAHLSDRLRGAGGFATPWPTDDPGLSRAERREVQTALLTLGYDIGEVDGIIGSMTRQAIVEVMAAQGIESDGRAGRRALEVLRALVR